MKRFWVYHDNKGVIAGPFKTKSAAQKRMDDLIRESVGQSLWLSITSQRNK